MKAAVDRIRRATVNNYVWSHETQRPASAGRGRSFGVLRDQTHITVLTFSWNNEMFAAEDEPAESSMPRHTQRFGCLRAARSAGFAYWISPLIDESASTYNRHAHAKAPLRGGHAPD